MPALEEFRDNALAFVFTAGIGGLVLLPVPLYFVLRSRRLLPLQRLRPGKWTGVDVWLAFVLLLFLVPAFVRDLLEQVGFYRVDILFEQAPSPIRKDIWASPLTTLFSLGLLFWLLFARSGTRPHHLGLTLARWPQNVVVGYLGFLVLTPLIHGIFFGITILLRDVLETPITPHDLEKLLKETLQPVDWMVIFLRAVVQAALLEEILFRGVLQGWLRRASFVGHATLIVLTLILGLGLYLGSLTGAAENGAAAVQELNVGPLIFAVCLALGYGALAIRVWSPVLSEGKRYFWPEGDRPDGRDSKERSVATEFSTKPLPQVTGRADSDPTRRRWQAWQWQNAYLSIFGSSMLWAMAHGNIWPTPVPLFLLGLGIGYLALRTQSLLPGILLHALFNTVSCVVMLMS